MSENKKEFVEKYLQPMIKQADSTVKSVTYHKSGFNEIVDVEYIGGLSFCVCVCVCVTADSKQEIVKDVLRWIW